MMPDSIGIVIPARDEAAEILGCLDSVKTAFKVLERELPDVWCRVYVIADGCTDATAEQVRAWDHAGHLVELLITDGQNVGKARALGVERYLAERTGKNLATSWIAATDADSRVPPHWLLSQVHDAAAGADCVVGTVEPRAETASVSLVRAWFTRHTLEEGHPHVFGANLGIRGSWYERVGGFFPLSTGEDVELVDRLRTYGANVVSTDTARVATSARLEGRVSDGFSTYCREL